MAHKPEQRLLGGKDLTEVIGVDMVDMVAGYQELLGQPLVHLAIIGQLKLTPEQTEELSFLLRKAFEVQRTGDKILANLADQAARQAPVSMAIGTALRLGLGTAAAARLCYRAMRLYEEVTGNTTPGASELTAKMDALTAKLDAKLDALTATQAAQTATLDTIQTHTAGVPAMVEREQIDSARELQRLLAQVELLGLPPEELRLVRLWYSTGNKAEIARQMQLSRQTVYNMMAAIRARYRERGLPDPFVKRPSIPEAERQRQRDARDRQAGGAERGMGDAWHSEQ